MSGSDSSAPACATPRAEALEFAVHSLPVVLLDDDALRRTRSGRIKMFLVFAVCAVPVLASYFSYFVWRPEGRSNYSALIEPSRRLPDLPLTDLRGATVSADSLKSQWLLVVVAGGACDAACEGRLLLQRQLRETLGKERDRVDKLWLIPDEQAVRPELTQVLATSPAMNVLRVPRAALEVWLDPAPGRMLEQHLYIVDPHGDWMMRAPPDPAPERLKRDIDRLLRASASWDRPGR